MITKIIEQLDSLRPHESNYQQVYGVKFMIKGLEYHYENYMIQTKNHEKYYWFHEVVAYLNILGQIYYFFKSDYICVTEVEIPNILKIIPLRMKYSAHRSVDAPRMKDGDHLVMMDISIPSIHSIRPYYGDTELNPKECSRGFGIPSLDVSGDRNDIVVFLDYEHQAFLIEIESVLTRKINELGI
ncbi:MAG: hypothetical protein ACI87J_002382 [Colwellia sp.]|jgi:hypothetical protein